VAAFYFRCGSCKHEFAKLLPRVLKDHKCPKCGARAKRAPRAPTSNVTETLDNGLMARRVERIQGATEIYRERSRADKVQREVVVVRGKLPDSG